VREERTSTRDVDGTTSKKYFLRFSGKEIGKLSVGTLLPKYGCIAIASLLSRKERPCPTTKHHQRKELQGLIGFTSDLTLRNV
jgi:hypothetical protein